MNPKPVWEETWKTRVGEDYSHPIYLVMPDEREYLFGDYDRGCASDPTMDPESNDDDRARARLAACAPELARLLLKGLHCEDEQCCIACGAMTAHHYKEWSSHKADCFLVALLRKAGVLE